MRIPSPGVETLEDAREHAWSIPIDDINVTHWDLWENGVVGPYFERLRAEDPVHFHRHSHNGPYWSITRHADIMHVDTHHKQFSSEGSIVLLDQPEDFPLAQFIAMDPPRHDEQRNTVSPVVAPRNLAALEATLRERVVNILDELPEGEPFNWVDAVSIELTTQMLATLFDFPFEQRRKLTRWSDVATGGPETGVVSSREQARAELQECLDVFTALREERAKRPPAPDLVSMLAHGPSTRNMPPMEFLGNLILLIVGGNDTTRNSISGGVLALNRFPDEFAKLRANPGLTRNLVAEIIRWQTPLAYMRRTATEDVEVGGKLIREGDKVAMWYYSGNRDEYVFDDPDVLKVERPNARHHVAFGYGIHRCMGNRLAEMQLRVMWEELLPRFKRIEVVGEPVRIRSNFINGYSELPVVLKRA
ncbi:MAG: cytochrome P450 [Gammaproteobacteria bacterium]|nr:MAG: cytochrome P450 [Gammaproteobacteria bacterium]